MNICIGLLPARCCADTNFCHHHIFFMDNQSLIFLYIHHSYEDGTKPNNDSNSSILGGVNLLITLVMLELVSYDCNGPRSL